MQKDQLWQAVLGELELTLSKASFVTWFKDTFISSYENGQVIIAVPNTFTKTWFENKYHKAILKALKNVTKNRVQEISYKIKMAKPSQKMANLKEIKIKEEAKEESFKENKYGLNPRYAFENFVVGKGNELAHAAALAVAEKPGKVYNPLFIYGGVGLGKTHLMQAIGHKVIKNFPQKKILYVPCEKFANEFIQAISTGRTEKFKNKYRSVDIFLMDDIQFLAGKEGTQEEFFHTFNTLHQDDKQIILSSDRPPKAIPTLESRMTSRFEWGMIVDITAPDLETRMAILTAKCKEKNYPLSHDILNYIATTVQNNIRELEGCLNRIIAYHQLNNTQPTLENTRQILSSLTKTPKKGALTFKQLTATVAEYYDIKVEDLVGKSRKRELVVPRQIAMYLMRKEMKSSYPAIGQELGGRDHTTAMHAYTKISKDAEDDEKTREDINLIRERLYR